MEKTFNASAKRVFRRLLPIAMALLLPALLLWNGLAGVAKAETEPLEVKIEPGFSGKIKEGRWFPVTFTIKNPGGDLSGDLTVEIASPGRAKDTAYAVHVDLPQNSTKVVTMTLPGVRLDKRNNAVRFYKGGMQEGKAVPFAAGSAYVETEVLSAASFRVGVAARDPDTLNFLALLNQRGYQVSTVPLAVADMPREGMMLDGLDALVFNDVDGSVWKKEQVEAVTAWVQRGGLLFLAGGAGYEKTAAPFAMLAPVQAQGTAKLDQAPGLERAAGKALKLSEPFPVSKAVVKEGRTVYAENGLPLFAAKPYGQGEIWYVAYDLALEPVASWSGNPELWESVLADRLQQAADGGGLYGQSQLGQGFWEISRALEYFPSLSYPSFAALLSAIVVYAIAAGPALYWALRRFGKREWAWGLIPLLAVAFSAGIYTTGASGRGSTMAQLLSVVEMNGDGQGTETSAVSLFVPKGGTYTLQVPGGPLALPLYETPWSNGSGEVAGEADVRVERKPDETAVQFRRVPFWTMSKVWFADSKVRETGKFDYALSVDGSGIKGELTNNTKETLDHVTLLVHRRTVEIGSLRPGESRPISAAVGGSQAWWNPPDIAQAIFPDTGRDDEHRRERALLTNYLFESAGASLTDKPIVIGFSRAEGVKKLGINGKETAADELTLWTQKLSFSFVSAGKAYVPPGVVKPVVLSGNLNIKRTEPSNFFFADSGETELQYKLPIVEGVTFTTISRMEKFGDVQAVQVEIWNEQEGKWENADADSALSGVSLEPYLTDGRAVRIKLTVKRSASLKYPELGFEGVAGP